MKITVRNYRAFDDEHPADWSLADDFRAFVGTNNSGKSTLLRLFNELRPTLELLAHFEGGGIQNMMRGEAAPTAFNNVVDPVEVFCNRNERDMSVRFAFDGRLSPSEPPEPSAMTLLWRRSSGGLTVSFSVAGVDETCFASKIDRINSLVTVATGGRNLLLDVSRYRETFQALASSVYLGPFRNAVNVGGMVDYYDLQIGESFISQWDEFKSGENRAHNRMALAVERELTQIFGLKNLQINAVPGNRSLQIIADDQPYQLQEQGAGLAQFILVLAFVASRKPPYVFIDEPEQNLHPSLQIDFLTTLAKYTQKGVIFATHSIGLARAVAQEVYSVRRLSDEAREVRRLEATRDYVEFLGELGFAGYEEIGFRRILLVEGTSEVATVQRLLRLYRIEHEVVLLPLGGSSMINGNTAGPLSELKRISSNVSVLIDSEKSDASDILCEERQQFVDNCAELGFNVHVLHRRAIENYLSDNAVKILKGNKYMSLEPYQRLRDAAMPWGKNENWRIAAEMNRNELDGTDLGHFFEGMCTLSSDTE